MMKKTASLVSLVVLAASLLLASVAFAHTPICYCYDNGDGTITCEGGFSDGSSAAGVKMTVFDKEGNVLISGEMDADSEFTFDKPDCPYDVVFDAGPGHVVKTHGEDITE
jgi:hypothetical protein